MGFGAKTLPLWLRKRRGRSKIVYPQVVDMGGGSTPDPEPILTIVGIQYMGGETAFFSNSELINIIFL